jgi:DNA-binding beta-propeller fold protein YncE
MRKLILIALTAMILAPAASAQDAWYYKGLLNEEADTRDGHGIAVDPDGKIWFQSYYATGDSVEVPELGGAKYPTRTIQVFNPDGSVADISPIFFYEESGVRIDTVGGEVLRNSTNDLIWGPNSGRGMTTDEDGNILVGYWDYLYRFDYQTGEGLGMVDTNHPNGLIKPAVATETGNIFTGNVFPGSALVEWTKDLSASQNALDATLGFSRTFEVSPDGNKIYWGGFTTRDVILYERVDEFEAFDSIGVIIPGMSAESFAWQPVTGYLWVSAGSPNDAPNLGHGEGVTNWLSQTWYAFDAAELEVDVVPVPKAFITWNIGEGEHADGRPRGQAFSPDGELSYVVQFNQPTNGLQVFSATPVAIEKLDDTVPDRFILMQAYPNPFNPSTTINFMLHEAGHARLAVYDVSGREVAVLADQAMAPGTYQYTFDAAGLGSGVYLYRLDFGGQVATGRMTLVK